jgi:hypothetical protein
MRVANWAPEVITIEIEKKAMKRLKLAAELIKMRAKLRLRNQIGLGKTTGISHGPYKTGSYAGQPWTARHFGSLLKTLRVVEKKEEYGTVIGEVGNYRVYAGNYLVWWAKIFEFYRPYLRPALDESKSDIKSLLENGV